MFVKEMSSALSKIISRDKKIIGYVSGVFDLFHHGHESFLKKCLARCDILIVGVDSDSRTKILKGEGRPVNGEDLRLSNVKKLCEFSILKNHSSEFYIKKFNVDIVFLSSEYQLKFDKFINICGMVEFIEYTEGISTSKIINQCGVGIEY